MSALKFPEPITVVDDWDVVTHPDRVYHLNEILADPPNQDAYVAAIIRRLIAASAAPIAVGLHPGPHRDRLDAAGWLNVGEDADWRAAREAAWPQYAEVKELGVGFGSLRPELVIVTDKQPRDNLVPLSDYRGLSLWPALRAMGYDELRVFVCSSSSFLRRRWTRKIASLFQVFSDAQWLGLGSITAGVLNSAEVRYLEIPPCPPKADPKAYREQLLKAGLGERPATVTRRNVVTVEALPALPAPYDMRETVQRRRLPKGATPDPKRGGRSAGVNPVARERARRAYVTGSVKNFTEAARLVGVSPSALNTAAREGNWRAERDEYQRQVTEDAKKKAADVEVRAVANCRMLAWGCAEASLHSVLTRMKDKDNPYKPSPKEAAVLALTAIRLSQAEVGTGEEVESALRSKSLSELAKEVLDVTERQFGGAK